MLGWLLLVALGGLAALLGRRLFAGYRGPAGAHLAPRELATVTAAADAFFPPGGSIPQSGSEAGVPAYLDRYVGAIPRRVGLLIRALLLLVEHATLAFPGPGPGGRRRFSSLDARQRAAVLEGWRSSRLFPRRLVFTSLRALVTLGYFADPAVLRRLELAPYALSTPVCPADLLYPPVGRPRSAIRYGPDDLTPPSDGTPIDLQGPLHPDYRSPGEPGA